MVRVDDERKENMEDPKQMLCARSVEEEVNLFRIFDCGGLRRTLILPRLPIHEHIRNLHDHKKKESEDFESNIL
jgi:hypothetical protein